MRPFSVFTRVICPLFFATPSFAVEPVEKAERYHRLLLKNAGSETLMTRFLDAWLDEQDREALEEWLTAGAEKGGAAERRVLARYLDHLGAQDRALAQYLEVLKLEPDDHRTRLALARIQVSTLDFQGALKTLEGVDEVEAVTLRGACEHRLGNTAEALKLWRGLLEKKPGDRELREDLVSLFREEGLVAEALELQKELIARGDDPFRRALDQLDLGDLQLDHGLKEEALKSFRQVLAVSGSESWMEREALHRMHEVFRRERDAVGLRKFLGDLREDMPQRMALQKSFARQLVVTGEVDRGTAVFRELLRRSPGDEALRREFVELLALAEHHREAAEILEGLIAVEATAERWLRLAEMRKEFAVEKVPATLAEVEKLKNDGPAGILEMARIYPRFDLDDEARRVLESGRAAHPDSREIREALAVFLIERERKDEALAIWRELAEGSDLKEVLRVAQSLRRYRLIDEAFTLVTNHRQELAQDLAGLRFYAELAFEHGEIESAWTAARQWVMACDDFSELERAVNLGLAIGRRHGLEKAISELEGAEEENVRCLLAALLQMAGRLPEADAVLAQSEGEFGQRQRVALLAQRGAYDAAITELRGMMGARVTLAQRRHLLELLEQKGDFEGALAEAGQWKISSPGEVRAWRKRAALLVKLGRPEEAANELRRARNRFGKEDVALTRELAQMQLPLGRHREALRLFEHLFRTAPTEEDRLQFLDDMYAAARQAGLEGELLSRFEREHERAKQELFPLRVLARLHELSQNPGARQEVLLKLYRLQPDDEGVLFELVELAEQNRDQAGARQLLLEHAARTRSAELLARLARMQFKAGEVDAGLKILSQIAPDELTPGEVEATILLLWQQGEHQLVFEFLEENEALLRTNWRLRWRQADFLERVSRLEEAREIWVELLAVTSPPGQPVSRSASRLLRIPVPGKMNQGSWAQLLQVVARLPARPQHGPAQAAVVPKDAHEVRWLSLARLATMSLRDDPSGESWQAFLETQPHPWLAKVRGWTIGARQQARPFVSLTREVKQTPGRRFVILAGDPESSREDFLKLASEIEDENPDLALSCRIHAAFKLPEGAEKMTELRQVADLIAQGGEGRFQNARIFSQLVVPEQEFGLFPGLDQAAPTPAQQEKLKMLEPLWQDLDQWLLARRDTGRNAGSRFGSGGRFGTPSMPTQLGNLGFPGWLLGVQRLSGDLDGFFENLNRLMKIEQVSRAARQGQTAAGQHYSLIGGLPARRSLLPTLASRHPIYAFCYQAKAPKLIPPTLREKVAKLGGKPRNYEALEAFAERIPQLEDGFLRALLYHKIGLEEKFLTEMEALAEKGGLTEKLDALVCRDKSPLPSENKALLGALLAIDRSGLSAAEGNLLDGVTLGELRKSPFLRELDGETQTALGQVLKRYAESGAGRKNAPMLRSLYQPLGLEMPPTSPSRGRPRNRPRQSYRQLLSATANKGPKGNSSPQGLDGRFLDSLKRQLDSRESLESLRRTVSHEQFRGLQDEILAFYEPGESRSYRKRFRYALLCLAYGEKEKAREVLAPLQVERPYDGDLEVLLLLTLEAREREAVLDERVQDGGIAKLINLLTTLAGATNEEEFFFETYERLVSLLEKRAHDFTVQDAMKTWEMFRNFQNLTKSFENRSLHRMNSPLPKVEAGQDSKEGDWAARVRQRKIIIAAYIEMMRLRSIRSQVLMHLESNMDALRLNRGNVGWMVFEALRGEPVIEKAEGAVFPSGLSRSVGTSGPLVLKAFLKSADATRETLEQIVRHDFLNERQGELVQAVLEGEAAKVAKLLADYHEEKVTSIQQASSQEKARRDSETVWSGLLETMLRFKRWDDPVRDTLKKGLAEFKRAPEFRQWELSWVCEFLPLQESLAAVEAVAAKYFPPAAMRDDYLALQAAGVVLPEIEEKIRTGQSLLNALTNTPRAWIPLLTFLENSEQAIWVSLDEEEIRTRLRTRLDVMYKRVLYDRLQAEGFSLYDGLALLGAGQVTEAGEIVPWLEKLITPLKLSPTEGRTYWANVSADCREQIEDISYLEAFIAMRKDFRIDDGERLGLLHRVLESECRKLSALGENQLGGLANLVRRDFPDLRIPEASGELEALLKRLRATPKQGIVARLRGMMANAEFLSTLARDEAIGLCTRLAAEGEVKLAAGFWVNYLTAQAGPGNGRDMGSMNFQLLARPPFRGTLDLIDAVRFVRLVREGLGESPNLLGENITYTRDILSWRETFKPFSGGRGDPAGVVAFLDEVLQRDGVADSDRRVMAGFLIKADTIWQAGPATEAGFRLHLEKSGLAAHSPGIVDTILAILQLRGARDEGEDAKALKVISDYLLDPELAPDFRADLAKWFMGWFDREEGLRQLADAGPVAVALRDLLLGGSYGKTGNLHTGGPMQDFVNQHLATVPDGLQKELYEAWTVALQEDARKVLGEKVGRNRSLRLVDILFDFFDGGRRFPIPQVMIDGLIRDFAGDLELMQKFIRAGKVEMALSLLPDAPNERFRLTGREYSLATRKLEKEVLPVIPEKDQVMLRCFLASLRDARDWKAAKESAGHLQDDRLVAAARLFVAKPPEEQTVRLDAISLLERSVAALEILMPHFSGEFQDDLRAVAERHQGDLAYMRRWLQAGGAKTVHLFAPNAKRPLKLYRNPPYDREMAELERLLLPALPAVEKAKLICALAVLPDVANPAGDAGEIPAREMRLKEAARHLLENPLSGADREAEQRCITQLVKGGLAGSEAQALVRRGMKQWEKVDGAMLRSLSRVDAEMLGLQLRTAVAEGDIVATMSCLQILSDPGSELSTRQRGELITFILPEVTLPLVARASRQVSEKTRNEELAVLKKYGTDLHTLIFTEILPVRDEAERAVLFLTFATHCLTGDREEFEGLQRKVPPQGQRALGQISRKNRSYRLSEEPFLIPPAAQPRHFDEGRYLSDQYKDLRVLLFEKSVGQSLIFLPAAPSQANWVHLMNSLQLEPADLELPDDALASQRGNLSLLAYALVGGNHPLFLALLPTKDEVYSESRPTSISNPNHLGFQRTGYLPRQLGIHWRSHPLREDLDLIEDNFQRMHFEIFLQSLALPVWVDGWIYDLNEMDAAMEARIQALLPKTGPARAQVIARLARMARPGSPLAQTLVARASAKDFHLQATPDEAAPLAPNERIETFLFGWICELHTGGWSVLDRQFQSQPEGAIADFLSQCAGVQALYEVAGDGRSHPDVLKRLAGYGLAKTDPAFRPWFELLDLVAGAKTSRWREQWSSLDDKEKRESRAAMASGLRTVFEFLANLPPMKDLTSTGYPGRRSGLRKIWRHPRAREEGARLITAVMDDETGLFGATGISAPERARLLIGIVDWKEMKDRIESQFEGPEKQVLLTELALGAQVSPAADDDLCDFIETLASQSSPDRPIGSRLWLKVASGRIEAEDLEGARAARKKIETADLKEHELRNLDYRIERLASATKASDQEKE